MTGPIDGYWKDAETALSGLGNLDQSRLNTAVSAVDAVWDRIIFDHARSFGGAEVGDAIVLSAAVLTKLLAVDHVALASATGSPLPPTGDQVIDESLEQACHEALNTFSPELLGPETVDGSLIYALPILLESPVPVGAVLLVTSEPITLDQENLLREFLRHLDTRMTAAQHLYALRREILELQLEVGKVERTPEAPKAARARMRKSVPDGFSKVVEELVETIPSFVLFDVEMPTVHFGEFCNHLTQVTDRYLTILDEASSLYLDIPASIDAKSKEKASAPYLKLLEIISLLRPAAKLMYQISAEELAVYAAHRRAPTFADLTRVAKKHTDDETTARILDIMNDQGEEEEVDALYARHHPYEFRAANLGEVFALIAVHRTLMYRMPDRLDAEKPQLLSAMAKYQAARAFLFAYDQFSDVPLRGEKRHEPRNAQALLFRKENAPSFGLLLRAYQQEK